MKKAYVKPEAEYLRLIAEEALTDAAGGLGPGETSEGTLPPGWDDDEF